MLNILPTGRTLLSLVALIATASLLAACQDAEAPADAVVVPADAPLETSTPATAPAGDNADGEDHAHGSPHGGTVKTAGAGHLELVTEHTAFRLYVLDGNEQTLPVAGIEGAQAVVQIEGGGTETVPLTPMDDHLHATLSPTAAAYTAVVSVPVAGETRSARFVVGLDSHTQHAH